MESRIADARTDPLHLSAVIRLSAAPRVGTMMARFEERKQVVAVGERDRATRWRLPG